MQKEELFRSSKIGVYSVREKKKGQNSQVVK